MLSFCERNVFRNLRSLLPHSLGRLPRIACLGRGRGERELKQVGATKSPAFECPQGAGTVTASCLNPTTLHTSPSIFWVCSTTQRVSITKEQFRQNKGCRTWGGAHEAVMALGSAATKQFPRPAHETSRCCVRAEGFVSKRGSTGKKEARRLFAFHFFNSKFDETDTCFYAL